MKKNKKRNKKGIVYSTNPNFIYEEYQEEKNSNEINNKEQKLYIHLERNRAGKKAVIIKNFIGEINKMKDLSRMIKTKCSVGGSIKKGEIIIQGDIRDKVIDILKKEGYVCKKSGG